MREAMDWMRKLGVRLTGWIRGRAPEDETAEEIRLHLEERTAELERSGVPPSDAAAQARREFGGALLAVEDSREAWRLGWIEDLIRDLRYGARALRRDPAFALASIASLALAIGVNTTAFSLTTEFLFSEPSARDPSRLVLIRIGGNSHASPDEAQLLRDAAIYDGLTGYSDGEVNWNAGDSSSRLFTIEVAPNFFEVTGVPLAAGRPIAADDRNVVVLSDRFWRTRLNADPAALSRELELDGRSCSIIGILPADHRTLTGVGYSPDVYVPLLDPQARMQLYGRLREGMSREAAREATRVVAAELDRIHPQDHYRRADDVRVDGITSFSRMHNIKTAPLAVFFSILMAAVGLVLWIACINVAGLLLARAAARSHEIAVRISLGASRGRLLRQLLAESLLLAAVATGAGVGLNLILARLLNQVRLPLPVPIHLRIDPDWRLLLYGVAVAAATAVLAGLLPALQAVRPAPAIGSTRAVGVGARLRAALVVGQVAVTFIVLAAAVMALRSLAGASSLSPGFDVDRLVYASVRLTPERYADDASVEALRAAALERVRALPGVESAAIATTVPFNDQETNGGTLQKDGSGEPLPARRASTRVSPDYFRTMGIGIVSGREFTAEDVRSGARVAVVNETFAQRIWGRQSPVGRTVRFGDGEPVAIVGVCRNSKFMTIGEDDKAAFYEPYRLPAGDRRAKLEILMRTAAPESLTRAVEQSLLALDRSAAVEVRPMARAIGMALLPSQIGAGLFGVIGLVGLGLASLGLYGVLVYGVARRVREIGVRMALGASGASVLRLVLADTARIVAAGLGIGAAAAMLLTQPLSIFLIEGVRPADPANYAWVGLTLILVGLAASVGPVMSAVRIAPSEALRAE